MGGGDGWYIKTSVCWIVLERPIDSSHFTFRQMHFTSNDHRFISVHLNLLWMVSQGWEKKIVNNLTVLHASWGMQAQSRTHTIHLQIYSIKTGITGSGMKLWPHHTNNVSIEGSNYQYLRHIDVLLFVSMPPRRQTQYNNQQMNSYIQKWIVVSIMIGEMDLRTVHPSNYKMKRFKWRGASPVLPSTNVTVRWNIGIDNIL